MNDEGMKQGQRFMAPRRIEYVWLSAVGGKQLSLNDRHKKKDLLNDFLSPKKPEEEAFLFLPIISLSLLLGGFVLKLSGLKVNLDKKIQGAQVKYYI